MAAVATVAKTTRRKKQESHQDPETDKLIEQGMGAVRAIAANVKAALGGAPVELTDLESAGYIGLIEAARNFNDQRGVGFTTFARLRIKGSMLDFLREQDWASRDCRRRIKQYEATVVELSGKLHRSPERGEICKAMDITDEKLDLILLEASRSTVSQGADHTVNDETLPALDPPADPSTNPDRIASAEQLAEFLRKRMDESLSPRYQMLIELYYTSDLTMKEIGQAIGVNESRVSQMHKSALNKLREACREQGINTPDPFLHG